MPDKVHYALSELLVSYGELNSPVVNELYSEPSPLEFMRYVARNTPFVVRKAGSAWAATRKWDAIYLKSVLEGQTVNVAVTPAGNADSPTYSPEHGETFFAKPLEEEEHFPEFLDYVIKQERDPDFPPSGEVRYAQTQNDNMREEYISLFPDIQKDIPFARIALEKPPEAVNLWIGGSRSVTAIHKDNYENIYVQIKGRKHFILLPPLSYHCMNEISLRPATYVRGGNELELIPDDTRDRVPFATWDPDTVDVNATDFSRLARPIKITLEPGDMLYLPAMWYHKVSQSCMPGDEGFVVAVNYWYDMDFTGPFYPFTQFQRNISKLCQQRGGSEKAIPG